MKKVKSKIKKKSKTENALLKDKLWELCKTIIRKRDGKVCFICGKKGLSGAGWHTGHFIPSSTCGAYLRFDLRNLHSSCYYCNINLGGNGAMFYKRLVEVYGQEFVDRIFQDKQVYAKVDKIFYENKIEEYKKYAKLSKAKLIKLTKIFHEREALNS